MLLSLKRGRWKVVRPLIEHWWQLEFRSTKTNPSTVWFDAQEVNDALRWFSTEQTERNLDGNIDSQVCRSLILKLEPGPEISKS